MQPTEPNITKKLATAAAEAIKNRQYVEVPYSWLTATSFYIKDRQQWGGFIFNNDRTRGEFGVEETKPEIEAWLQEAAHAIAYGEPLPADYYDRKGIPFIWDVYTGREQ